jgi:hypothetical protein
MYIDKERKEEAEKGREKNIRRIIITTTNVAILKEN